MNKNDHKCPTCDGYIPNNEQIGEYSGAISRRNSDLEICSACGNREAIEDYLASSLGISSEDPFFKNHIQII